MEVCNCKVLYPCWIGEDPDKGTCDSVLAYHFNSGSIEGVDVAGLTLGLVVHIPGNVLKGNFRVVMVVDEKVTPQQEEAILKAYRGSLGGPLEDMSKLIGEVVAVERASITFEVNMGNGTLKIGQSVEAQIDPYRGPNGRSPPSTKAYFPPFRAVQPTSPRLLAGGPNTPRWVSILT